MKSDVRVFPDADALSQRAAESAVSIIDDAVRRAGRCSLVLSGGSTPRTFYGLLASQFRDRIPWTHVHLFWGDERYVPPGDSRSNYRMVKEALLDRVPCPATNIHPMPTRFSAPDAAARDYEATLRSYFAGAAPRFDLVLLGIGAEGHTASLFPGSAALKENTRWVVAVTVPAEPPQRLTLTLPVLTQSANTCFLVTGSNKSAALRHVLAPTADPDVYPAAGVRPAHGALTWWVDREAAADLSHAQGASPESTG